MSGSKRQGASSITCPLAGWLQSSSLIADCVDLTKGPDRWCEAGRGGRHVQHFQKNELAGLSQNCFQMDATAVILWSFTWDVWKDVLLGSWLLPGLQTIVPVASWVCGWKRAVMGTALISSYSHGKALWGWFQDVCRLTSHISLPLFFPLMMNSKLAGMLSSRKGCCKASRFGWILSGPRDHILTAPVRWIPRTDLCAPRVCGPRSSYYQTWHQPEQLDPATTSRRKKTADDIFRSWMGMRTNGLLSTSCLGVFSVSPCWCISPVDW